jgi:hypothetical protein
MADLAEKWTLIQKLNIYLRTENWTLNYSQTEHLIEH